MEIFIKNEKESANNLNFEWDVQHAFGSNKNAKIIEHYLLRY